MDIKKELLALRDNNESNIRNTYFTFENLIITMLSDYVLKQGKELLPEWKNSESNYRLDAYIPDGFDGYEGDTGIEIKFYRQRIQTRLIYDTVGRLSMQDSKIKNLIIIMVGEVGDKFRIQIQKEQKKLAFNLYLWDLDDLVKIFEQNVELFVDTINNLNKAFFKDTVIKGISDDRPTYVEKRVRYISEIEEKYRQDDIVLFLGAGASMDAKIATWDNLISELFVALVDHQLDLKGIKLDEAEKVRITREIINQNGNSPLLQTRFIQQGIESGFEDIVRDTLYKNATKTSKLLTELSQICVPDRGKIGIRAIINYNFDDLVEKNLENVRIKYCSVFREGVVPENDEIGIFHVHGFLPENIEGIDNLTESLLVFSEEGYHKLMLEPYNWANITQLSFLMNNTCIFIGLSMTDPNLRRLLDIAAKKEINGKCKHYAIMKRFTMNEIKEDERIKKFEQINEELQETFYKALGVNIIWIDDYNEIAEIIKKIKEN